MAAISNRGHASAAAPAETRWNPAQYGRSARFVADLGAPVLDLLAPLPGERILDLGCGDGALTKDIVAAGARVRAIDSSPEQIAAARALGLDARVQSGEALDDDAAFDAVFSNATLHWIRDHDAMLAGVARALVPGGRFVAEFGGAGNVARVRAALIAALARRGIDGAALDPWYFPTPEIYRARLEAHGYRVDTIALIDRPTRLPGSLADWLGVFAQSFLSPFDEEELRAVVAEVEAASMPDLQGADGIWTVDYVRLRFRAIRP